MSELPVLPFVAIVALLNTSTLRQLIQGLSQLRDRVGGVRRLVARDTGRGDVLCEWSRAAQGLSTPL